MSQSQTNSESFVTEADFEHFRQLINQGQFQCLVAELMVLEPDVAIAIANRGRTLERLLARMKITANDSEALKRHVALAEWVPVLAMSRGHRRAWDGFLPSTSVVPGPNEKPEGGEQ